MDGRHDFSPLDRGRLFQHHHAHHHPGHPPGPTPPPPPLLSPVGFPEAAGGPGALASGLARQSLVELARVNAATPGGPLSCPPMPGAGGFPGRGYMPGPLSLHSPRSSFQSSLMNPFLSGAGPGGGGAGGGAGGAGAGGGGAGAGPSTTGAGSSSDATAAAYKSILSAQSLPPHYWPPPPPSPHTAPSTEGMGRHSLTGSLYPNYLPLLPGADNMALYSSGSSSTSPMGQSMHAYHRIYDLHKDAYLPGSLGTTSSSVSGVTDNPLFAYPHSSYSPACYTSGCSRVPMSATLELQEQALHFHLHQQRLQASFQEEQEREDWERRREREEREREREERGREERRDREDREREECERDRERESPIRPQSSSGSSSRKRSPPGRGVKTESDGGVKDRHSHHLSQHKDAPATHEHKQQAKSSPDVGVVTPSKSKSKGVRVAEVSGLQRQQAASRTPHADVTGDNLKHKTSKRVSDVKLPDEKARDTIGNQGAVAQEASVNGHSQKPDSVDVQRKGTESPQGVHQSKTPTYTAHGTPDAGVKLEPGQGPVTENETGRETREPEVDVKSKKCDSEELVPPGLREEVVPQSARVSYEQARTLHTSSTADTAVQAAVQSTLPHSKDTELTKPQTSPTCHHSSPPASQTLNVSSSSSSKCHTQPSRSAAPQSMVCLKKQLTENVPSDMLGRPQRLAESGQKTARHDPPRPVLTSALQSTRRLLHSPEGVLVPAVTSATPVTTSPTSAVVITSQAKRQQITSTTSTVSMTKMTSNVTVVTSASPDVGVYTMCPSSKPVSMVCLPTGVTVSSGESSSTVTRASHRPLGALYSYSHTSGNLAPETGPRKVHATTFTPEVGTVHQSPITSPVSSHSSNSNSSAASTSPTHADHRRAERRTHAQDAARAQGRPCLGTTTSGQQSHAAKQRPSHGKKKEVDAKPFCRLSSSAQSSSSSSSVLSRGPLSSSMLKSNPDLDTRGHHHEAEKVDHVTDSQSEADMSGYFSKSMAGAPVGGARVVPAERNVKKGELYPSEETRPDTKGHLPGALHRLATTNKDGAHVHSWPGGWPPHEVKGHTGLGGDGGSSEGSVGSIVPKEESADEQVSLTTSHKPTSGSESESQPPQQHSVYKWAGHFSAASKAYAPSLPPSHTVLPPGGAVVDVETGTRGVNTASRTVDMVVKEEDGSPERSMQVARDTQVRSGDVSGSGAQSQEKNSGVVSDTPPNAHDTPADVKPVLVHHAQSEHAARLVPVQPVVNGTQQVRHACADNPKEGNQSDEAPSTSGSNIPVGIAIARKRGDKRHTHVVKSDENGSNNSDPGTERVRHREGTEVEPQQASTRDNKGISAKPGTDIGPNLVVTGGTSRTWREGEEPSPGSANQSGVGAWLPAGPHPPLAPPMWLGQGGYPVPPTVDPAQLTGPPPGGLKLAQDPLTGQVYVIPDVPLEAGRVWPGGLAPGALQTQQLQFLQQQYAQLQQLQSQQQVGPAGPRPEAVKTEAPCRQEEQATAPHYQQLQHQSKNNAANIGNSSTDTARPPHGHFPSLKTSPPTQAPPSESSENSVPFSGSAGTQQPTPATPLLPPGEGGQNQGAHPFLVGLGQAFPGLPYPPHLPYYLDPALLQQLRGASGAPAVSTDTTATSRTDPVTVMSRGCSPIIFPDEEQSVTSQAVTSVVTSAAVAVGTSDVPMCSTVGSQTSPSPVLELLQMYAKEEGTQTSDAEEVDQIMGAGRPGLERVEVGIQLNTPFDSDSDSNCALTMPHLTARTIDCGTQADGCSATYSASNSVRIGTGHYYSDSDRHSASPPPPALVAEGSPPHHPPDAPPYLTDQEQYSYNSDYDHHLPSFHMPPRDGSVVSSCGTTPTHPAPRGKGIFDLGIDFLSRQILEASDGLELLSTLAERAQREQQGDGQEHEEEEDDDEGEEGDTERDDADDDTADMRMHPVTTDTEEDVETDINRNYNAPKASMFMDGPSMYSFSSKFASPSAKKDSLSRLSSAFSYTEEQVDASQIEMRLKLADLQRKYKEKQRQLARLQPRREREEDRHLIKRGPGRPRKRRFKKSSSKSESPSKSPRSEMSERGATSVATELLPKKKKKDSSSESKSSQFSGTPSKSKSKSSESKSSSSRRQESGTPSSSRSEKSSSKKKCSLSVGSSSGSKSSKSGSSKSKSSSSGSKSQSRKKDGKSSQTKKTKVKKEEKDLDLEDSELEDVSWLFDEDEINPPPTVFAPSPVKKSSVKSAPLTENSRSAQSSSSNNHERQGSPTPPTLAAASRSPYSFTESYDETSDEGSLGLLTRFAPNEMEVMRTSVAAATSAALKSKKRKKRPGGFGDPNDAPVKKRKPGRPKKYEHELETGMTETIVDKKSKSLSLLHINTNTTTSSSGSISSSSSNSSSSSASSAGPSLTSSTMTATAAATAATTATTATSTAEGSPKKKAKTSKDQRPKSESSVPFLEEEWCLRRSERIFLSDPNLNSPPLPADLPDKSLSASSKKSDADSGGATLGTPMTPNTSKLTSRPGKVSTPGTTSVSTSTTSVSTSTTTSSSSGGCSNGGGSLKTKSSSKVKSKVKTMHDLSQKVKKKYKKPLKANVTKAVQSTIKTEPLELADNKGQCNTSSTKVSSKVSGSSSKVSGGSSSKVSGGSSSKVSGGSSSKVSSGSSSKVSSGSSSKVSGNGSKIKYDQVYTDSDSDSETSSDGDNVPLSAYIERATTPDPRSCVISKDDLRGGLRVLIYMEGLFYEGQVRAIEPPDVYGVVIDGERGSRPHILSQEELLNEAVLDVQPASARCLKEGTRVCAYWSQQFSCLYPGTVARASPNPATDKNLVNVEFDDGDSGRIPIEHIRMLPHDYPVVTVGPSPILVLSKRRRRTVSDELMTDSKDRKQSGSSDLTSFPPPPPPPPTLSSHQHPDDPKQRRRLAKSSGRRRDDQDTLHCMPTIDEASTKTEPIDEYDAQREFGPDAPAEPIKDNVKENNKESKQKEGARDNTVSSEHVQSPTVPVSTSISTTSSSKKKHKHKEKKKERDKDRVKRSGSSGGDEHKHKHHHHHHHHHHHKKHKHRKSSTDSSSSKSMPTTPLVTGASTVKGSFLSHTPITDHVPTTQTTATTTSSGSSNSNNTTNSTVEAGSSALSHRASSELSINTSVGSAPNMMVTSPSPGGSGDKKLTMRIRTNSTDVNPLSPKHGHGETDQSATKPAAEKIVTEKSHAEKPAGTRQQENYSEDDSPDTSSDEEDDDDDDSDFHDNSIDGKGSSSKKKKSSMSTTSAGNKRRQTKRQTSVENKSKMAAFLPARQLWRWSGTSTRRPGMKGKAKKEFYKAITRGKEFIRVGDCAVFLSTGRPHLPYVGRIESLWEAWSGNMVVKVKWFYHPEETKGGKKLLEIKGALYQSPHVDENDVQTISHKCEVMRYTDYKNRAHNLRLADYDSEDVYYLAGTYEPTVGMITLEKDVKLLSDVKS